MALRISVIQGDVAQTTSDVLLLKFAQRFYGADEVVVLRLAQHGVCREAEIAPQPGEFRLVETRGVIPARHVLFVGTPRLREFRYAEMQQFARGAIEYLAEHKLPVATLTTTVHGAGYGLDIEEALRSMLLGFQQGLTAGPPIGLKEIVFVERNARRFEVLHSALAGLELVLPDAAKPADAATIKPAAVSKKSVFVAMPFTDEFEDVYQFGIYATVRRCGYVCEKVDESAFTGNIVEQITQGIRNAEFVIADMSQERPNVYLEVGFAWALQKPVILVAREGQRLHFDVSHHKCLFYKNISRLSDSLEKTIRQMFACPVENTHD